GSSNGGNGTAAPSQSTVTNPGPTNITLNVPNGQNASSPTAAPSSDQNSHHATNVDGATDEVGPRMGMVFRGLDSALKVRVRCPGDEESCKGSVAVRLNNSTLNSARFDLDGAKSRLVSIDLTRAQRRQLRRAGVVYLKATATDAAGNRQVRELSFQL